MQRYDSRELHRRIRAVAAEDVPLGSELTLGGMAIGWGVILLVWPDGLSRLPSFALLLRVMPQWGWAVACLLAGALAVVGVVLGRTWGRILALLCHVFLWTCLGMGVLISSPWAAEWWIYLCLAGRASWSAYLVALRWARGRARDRNR